MKENCQSKWIKKCKYAWSVPTTLLVLAAFCFSQKILVMLKSSILATINHVMDLQDIIRLPVPLKDLSQKSSYIYIEVLWLESTGTLFGVLYLCWTLTFKTLMHVCLNHVFYFSFFFWKSKTWSWHLSLIYF